MHNNNLLWASSSVFAVNFYISFLLMLDVWIKYAFKETGFLVILECLIKKYIYFMYQRNQLDTNLSKDVRILSYRKCSSQSINLFLPCRDKKALSRILNYLIELSKFQWLYQKTKSSLYETLKLNFFF